MGKIYAIDCDGTLCEERQTFERCLAEPKQNVIDIVNELYDAGNTIIIYTARGWQEYKMTERWLQIHGVKYHTIVCGKLVYDVILDDRAVNVMDVDKIKE